MRWYRVAVLGLLCLTAAAPPQTGPDTEKRFPPLKVPPGFKATLFACDPLIEYPSVIALGTRPGSLLVAVDYMTGLGTEITRRDEIRLIEDTNGDGYADKATVYAAGFNSIQGLAYDQGTVYAMHAPLLTALRDTDGDGVADERRDLLRGLGLAPEDNSNRLHCANGVVMGHDGWLYLALGDHGCDVQRPEGDRLVFEGGGILRCRPDGRDLHVFATGLRNIYDVALDEELNVFVRDNENDGGDYKIRVCHSFYSADHGYPYLYYERPDEAVPPLADLGLGSSAGGVCYLEREFPPEYRGNLFFCEWGRAVVRYRAERAGSSFAGLKEIEFAAGAEDDPYGFKPTDLVVDRDGSLLVSDWADGQRPRRGRGRIYRVAYVGTDERSKPLTPDPSPQGGEASGTLPLPLGERLSLRSRVREIPMSRGPGAPAAGVRDPAGDERDVEHWLDQLDSQSYYARVEAQAALDQLGTDVRPALVHALTQGRIGVRGRLHAVWVLAHMAGARAIDDLLALAKADPDARVQAQAVRAVADRTDPVLTHHHLDAGPGDADVAARLAGIAEGKDARVILEVVIALGRLRWPDTPDWLSCTLHTPDPAVAHAAMQAIRRSANWPTSLKLLDLPSNEPVRTIALRAAADRCEPVLVDGLVQRLHRDRDAIRRQQYADVLTRLYRKPGPWVYWGFRPAARPPGTVAWERTEVIGDALDFALADADRQVRLAALRRMQREKIPTRLATLLDWLPEEHEPDRVAAVLDSLGDQRARDVRGPLGALVRDLEQSPVNRLRAIALLVRELDESAAGQLIELAGELEDGPVLAEALRQAGRQTKLKSVPLLVAKLDSQTPDVRVAAIEALTELRSADVGERVPQLLEDPDARVRRAAAAAAGTLRLKSSGDRLLDLARDADPAVRSAGLDALRQLGDVRALPLAVAALNARDTELAALDCVGELGNPEQTAAVAELAKRDPSLEVLHRAARILTSWGAGRELPAVQRQAIDRALAAIHGTSGILLCWSVTGPLDPADTSKLIDKIGSSHSSGIPDDDSSSWERPLAAGMEARVRVASTTDRGGVWLARADVFADEPTAVQFLGSSSGSWRVWLNGQPVHRRELASTFQPDSDRFEATLAKGPNRLLVQVADAPVPAGHNPRGDSVAEFHLRFRRTMARADRERLTRLALTRRGDPERGRKVFSDVEKSQCLKCHRLGEQGERVGPDLTGLGSRFSRIHVVESILEPSRTIAPSFQTVLVALRAGRVVTGVPIAETADTLTLADNQGKKHVLDKSAIDEQRPQPISTMPEDLDKRFTADEFTDLIEFLTSQKAPQAIKEYP